MGLACKKAVRAPFLYASLSTAAAISSASASRAVPMTLFGKGTGAVVMSSEVPLTPLRKCPPGCVSVNRKNASGNVWAATSVTSGALSEFVTSTA